MKAKNNDDVLFDALLKISLKEMYREKTESIPPSEELDKVYTPSADFDKKIKKLVSDTGIKEKTGIWAKRASKIAAAIAIFLTLSTVVLFTVEASRVYILNTIIKWNEKYVSFEFGGDKGDEVKNDPKIFMPEYIPEGFEITETFITKNTSIVVYTDINKNEIIISQSPAESTSMNIDNEQREYSEIQLNGMTAYLFIAKEKGDYSMIIWYDNDILLDVKTTLDVNELLRIAESFKK